MLVPGRVNVNMPVLNTSGQIFKYLLKKESGENKYPQVARLRIRLIKRRQNVDDRNGKQVGTGKDERQPILPVAGARKIERETAGAERDNEKSDNACQHAEASLT